MQKLAVQSQVSKLDVARRQLETAIRLFFYEGDFVSIHTLAAASFNVLHDLTHQAGEQKKSMRDDVLAYVKEDKKRWFVQELRKPENFMKHADRDASETLAFDPQISELFLIDAVRCYWSITGEKTLLTQAYFLWFMIEHPDIFVVPDEYRQKLSVGSSLTQGIPKSTLLEQMLPMLLSSGFTNCQEQN